MRLGKCVIACICNITMNSFTALKISAMLFIPSSFQPLATAGLYGFAFSKRSYNWNHKSTHSFQIGSPLVMYMYVSSASFMAWPFISSTEQDLIELGCTSLFVYRRPQVVSKVWQLRQAAINIFVSVFVWTYAFSFFWVNIREKEWDHMVRVSLVS